MVHRQPEEVNEVLQELEDHLAELLARRTVEDQIEAKVSAKMQERHLEYIRDIRAQVLKEEGGPDNAQTLKKFAELEILEQRGLSRSSVDLMRPQSLDEVIGQDDAIKSLLTKLSSPYPQHILLYGPPGVGKTTVRAWLCRWPNPRPILPLLRMLPLWRWMELRCAGILVRSPTP